MICKFCQKPFTNKNIGRRRIFCTNICGLRFHNAKIRKRNLEKKVDVKCPVCGTMFKPGLLGRPQKFCSKTCSMSSLQNGSRGIRKIIKRNLIKSLKNKPCLDCEKRFPSACMDFHHKQNVKKRVDIAAMVSRDYTVNSILNEAFKCEILCANCHRIRHAGGRGKNNASI